MVISSEIIEIVARSSDFYAFIAFSGQKLGNQCRKVTAGLGRGGGCARCIPHPWIRPC